MSARPLAKGSRRNAASGLSKKTSGKHHWTYAGFLTLVVLALTSLSYSFYARFQAQALPSMPIVAPKATIALRIPAKLPPGMKRLELCPLSPAAPCVIPASSRLLIRLPDSLLGTVAINLVNTADASPPAVVASATILIAPGGTTKTVSLLVSPPAPPSAPASSSSSSAASPPSPPSQVVGRRVFYDNSAWDVVSDFDAIAPLPPQVGHGHSGSLDEPAKELGKTALLPGQSATFRHYTSYAKGLNGIMVAIDRLALPAAVTAADFRFRVGNGNDLTVWTAAPAPRTVVVRQNVSRPEFPNLPDVIVLTWEEENPYTSVREPGAISNQWLEVTVLANERTGLQADDVFYFGNQIAESGNSATDAKVDQNDEIGARDHSHTAFNPAPLVDPYDFNRDQNVDQNDELLARNHPATAFDAIALIAPPAASSSSSSSISSSEPSFPGTGLENDVVDVPFPEVPISGSIDDDCPECICPTSLRSWRIFSWLGISPANAAIAPQCPLPEITNYRLAKFAPFSMPKPEETAATYYLVQNEAGQTELRPEKIIEYICARKFIQDPRIQAVCKNQAGGCAIRAEITASNLILNYKVQRVPNCQEQKLYFGSFAIKDCNGTLQNIPDVAPTTLPACNTTAITVVTPAQTHQYSINQEQINALWNAWPNLSVSWFDMPKSMEDWRSRVTSLNTYMTQVVSHERQHIANAIEREKKWYAFIQNGLRNLYAGVTFDRSSSEECNAKMASWVFWKVQTPKILEMEYDLESMDYRMDCMNETDYGGDKMTINFWKFCYPDRPMPSVSTGDYCRNSAVRLANKDTYIQERMKEWETEHPKPTCPPPPPACPAT